MQKKSVGKLGVGASGKSVISTQRVLEAVYDREYYQEVERTSDRLGVTWGVRRRVTVGLRDREGRLRSQSGRLEPVPSRSRRCVSVGRQPLVGCVPFSKPFQLFGDGKQAVVLRGCIPSFCEGYPGGPVLTLTDSSLQNRNRSAMPREIYMTAQEE
jgi:hypothetical protein